jgi:hypothetical protein
VGLVAAPQLLLRVAGLAGLAADRRLGHHPWGFDRPDRPGVHPAPAAQGLRTAAPRGRHAALARRRPGATTGGACPPSFPCRPERTVHEPARRRPARRRGAARARWSASRRHFLARGRAAQARCWPCPKTRPPSFARDMRQRPIAEHVDAANDQHYELPPEFFRLVLGPRHEVLERPLHEARRHDRSGRGDRALAADLRARRAELMARRILELGCGWGSLSLWMAQTYPNARITAVSNSHGQRRHIEAQARERGLANLKVVTQDANLFEPAGRFDRIVSVEMFEHMANWDQLLGRARKPGSTPRAGCSCTSSPAGPRPTASPTRTRMTGSGSTSSPAASCPATT